MPLMVPAVVDVRGLWNNEVGYTRSQEHPTHTLDRPV